MLFLNWRTSAFRSLTLFALLIASTAPRTSAEDDFSKWEKEIAAFEASDRTNKPPANAVLFAGSSSIRLWPGLAADFPDLKTIQRGFGGSKMKDLLHFAHRIVIPYRPSKVVVYEGDNDIADGVRPEQIADEFDKFVQLVQGRLPGTKIYFIAIKPSPSRWKLAPEAKRANELIAGYARKHPQVHFIDIWNPMLRADGKPDPSLFRDDNLHLNEKGYALWRETVRTALADSGKEGR